MLNDLVAILKVKAVLLEPPAVTVTDPWHACNGRWYLGAPEKSFGNESNGL